MFAHDEKAEKKNKKQLSGLIETILYARVCVFLSNICKYTPCVAALQVRVPFDRECGHRKFVSNWFNQRHEVAQTPLNKEVFDTNKQLSRDLR